MGKKKSGLRLEGLYVHELLFTGIIISRNSCRPAVGLKGFCCKCFGVSFEKTLTAAILQNT